MQNPAFPTLIANMTTYSVPTMAATVGIVVLSLYAVYSRFSAVPEVLGLPWIGLGKGPFSNLRARIRSLLDMFDMIEEGYRKYSKNGQNFILPGITKSQVILPPSEIKWITEQPESVLSAAEAQKEELSTDYTLLNFAFAASPVHISLVIGNLSKAMNTLIPEVVDEIAVSVDEYWGEDTENWKEVGVFDTMMKVISRATNRTFVGLPLCRNEAYLTNASKFAGDVALAGMLIRTLPNFLKPFLAPICVIPNHWHLYQCSKYLIPFVKARQEEIRTTGKGPADFLTWNIEKAEKSGDAVECTPRRQMMRIMALNFAGIHTATFTATQMLFDLLSIPSATESMDEIREEVKEVLEEYEGKWSKPTLTKMVKTDSAIKESLRISTFLSHGMDRLVVAKDGVTTNNGLHLPYKTRIGTSPASIHHDEDMYKNSMTYEPFRFCQSDTGNASIVSTTEKFLSFGHGRHACPGRFFAAVEMKLLMAYIVTNYDIKPLETRPKNWVMNGSILPPMKATMSVRRRKNV